MDLTFAALADPTRRAILSQLMQGEASVTELGRPFHLSQPTISKHLQVLARAGLVERSRNAQFRPCRLNAARLEEAWIWIGDYRQFWEATLDRLDAYTKKLHAARSAAKKEEKKHGRKPTKRR